MRLKQLFADDKAVSPVIGVILMVAITVILAAVIGTFVLGLGDQVSSSAPQASFSFDFNEGGSGNSCTLSQDDGTNGVLEVTHDGGDSIDGSQLFVTDDASTRKQWNNCGGATEVTAGNTASPATASGETIRIVWENANGGDTNTLGKWTGPDA